MLRVFFSASTDRHFSKVHWRDHIQVWRTPNHLLREFAPFTRTYTRHHDDVLSIQWSPDSTYVFAVGSFRYRMMKLIATQMLHHHVEGHDYTLDPVEGFRPKTFAGYRDAVLSAYFSADGNTVSFVRFHSNPILNGFLQIYTVSKDGLSSLGKRKELRMMKIRTKNRLRRLRMALYEMSSIGVYTNGITSISRSSAPSSMQLPTLSLSGSPPVSSDYGRCQASRISIPLAFRKKKSLPLPSALQESGLPLVPEN